MLERARRPTLVVIAVVGLLAVLGAGAVSWVFSSKLLEPDHELGPFGIEVERVEVLDPRAREAELVSFERSEDSARRGIYGLDFEDGHAIAGRVERDGDGVVTRRVSDARGDLAEGTKVASTRASGRATRAALAAFPSGRSASPRSSARCRPGAWRDEAAPGRSSCTGTTPHGARAFGRSARCAPPGSRRC